MVGKPGPNGAGRFRMSPKALTPAVSRRLAVALKKSGEVGNPDAVARSAVSRSAWSAVVAAPVAAALAALISPLFVAIAAVPVVFLFIPELRLKDRAAQRKEGVERELPFFSVLASVLGGAGVPLHAVLKGLVSSEAFVFMRKEALIVRRDVEIFGMNPNESLERLAASHPSTRFADFLLGYTSKVRSGGDVPTYLSAEGGELLKRLEVEWGRYVARVGIVGSIMITAFGVVPLLLMVVGVFSPGYSVFGLVVFTGVGVPLITIGLVYLAGRMQPMKDDPATGRASWSLLAATGGAGAGLLTGAAWVAVATGLLLFFVAYGLSVRGQIREAREIDKGVSLFLKDLMEYKRQEYDLTKAVVTVASTSRYTPAFDRVLAKVASQLRAGVPLDGTKVGCRSRLGNITFLVLGEMSRSGGGTVDTVYQISTFADRMNEMRANASAEMKPYLVLSYVSPLLLAFGVTFVGGVVSSFSSKVGTGFSTFRLSGVQVGTPPAGMAQVSYLLIVVSAASLGLIGAKITDLTARNTLRASVNVMLAVAAVVLMGALAPGQVP